MAETTESRWRHVAEIPDAILYSAGRIACIVIGALVVFVVSVLAALAGYGPDRSPLPGPRTTATAWAHTEAEWAEKYRQILLELTEDRPEMEVFREQLMQERVQSLILRHRHECAVARSEGQPLPPLSPELRRRIP